MAEILTRCAGPKFVEPKQFSSRNSNGYCRYRYFCFFVCSFETVNGTGLRFAPKCASRRDGSFLRCSRISPIGISGRTRRSKVSNGYFMMKRAHFLRNDPQTRFALKRRTSLFLGSEVEIRLLLAFSLFLLHVLVSRKPVEIRQKY